MDDPSGAGGEISAAAAKRSKLPSTGSSSAAAAATIDSVDRLSALPDDLLAKILSSVSTPDAIQTLVLSKRWGSIWKLLPDLHFPFFPSPAAAFRDALSDEHHPLPLGDLKIEGDGHGGHGGLQLPSSIATWLPAAARRVTGSFTLLVTAAAPANNDEEAATVELPCFEHAASVSIDLWFRGRLSMPPAAAGGEFSQLTDLKLVAVRFKEDTAAEVGAAVSSARCPCLERLHIHNTYGLLKLAVSSTTLQRMELDLIRGLGELAVDAPELEALLVKDCFNTRAQEAGGQEFVPPPVIDVAAPALELLRWRDVSSQGAIWFAHGLPNLRWLGNLFFFVYDRADGIYGSYNTACLDILKNFHRPVETLTLALMFMPFIDGHHYAMEEMTVLPDLTTLNLTVISSGHCFGDSSLHVLRICTGMRKLVLGLCRTPQLEDRYKERSLCRGDQNNVRIKEPVPPTCPSGCICRQQMNWQNEELELLTLEEVEIQGFGRSDHDIGFVEKLFSWATSLTKVTIFFDESVSKGVAKELCWMFQFFPVPNEVHIDFRYHNNEKVSDAADEE